MTFRVLQGLQLQVGCSIHTLNKLVTMQPARNACRKGKHLGLWVTESYIRSSQLGPIRCQAFPTMPDICSNEKVSDI